MILNNHYDPTLVCDYIPTEVCDEASSEKRATIMKWI